MVFKSTSVEALTVNLCHLLNVNKILKKQHQNSKNVKDDRVLQRLTEVEFFYFASS
jgi:hypothetical protein